MELIKEAKKVYLENFPPETSFERAVFFSWYCKIADCKYCYMSTQPKEVIEKKKLARRSTESILAEFILCKRMGWDIGFFSGGHRAFTFSEFGKILGLINKAIGEKIWINLGYLTKRELKSFLPHIKGVVGAVETVNPEVHDNVCPSKPVLKIEKMFGYAKDLGLKKGITIILGLGETLEDFPLLVSFIKRHDIEKVHFYGLNPHPGTVFEKSNPPSVEYMSKWIAKTRIEFPKIDIQCGIWVDRGDMVTELLNAGSNSISKFPALRYFGTEEAKQVEQGAESAGRKFKGTLTKLPEIDPFEEVKGLEIDDNLKQKVAEKMRVYLKSMNKNSNKFESLIPK